MKSRVVDLSTNQSKTSAWVRFISFNINQNNTLIYIEVVNLSNSY